MTPTLLQLSIYPLKSAAPIVLDSAEVEPRGLRGDRRWMMVDAEGRFLTGRKYPRTTLIKAELTADGLRLDAPGMPSLSLSVSKTPRMDVTVWGDRVSACTVDGASDVWLSTYLGVPARFVHMDEAAHRAVDEKYAQMDDEVSFADGFPLLAISQAALDGLNAKLEVPVPMLRFRPNLVISGTEAHAEDGWKRIRIGKVEFDVVKACVRCVFTTVDPERGEFDARGEPLRSLLGYRRGPKGVTFGQNVIPRGIGRIRIGDPVEVLA